MTLSMWHILQSLEDLRPESEIHEGLPRITGLHLVTRQERGPWPDQYACLSRSGDEGAVTVCIFNGPDRITLRNLPDFSAVINRLINLLGAYGDWEGRLRQAAWRNDVQEIVDLGTEKLLNPILLFDLQGNVLAMSAMFLDDDSNPYWKSCRETQRVPLGFSAQAMTLENGHYASWTSEPRLYAMSGGAKAIGNFIAVDGELAAGFALHEAYRSIRPGDLFLVQRLQEALAGALKPRLSADPRRTLAHILRDMLAGLDFEEQLYGMVRLPCKAPWRLMIVADPRDGARDPMVKQLLMPRLRSLAQSSVTLEFDGHIVVLVSEDDVTPLLRLIEGDSAQPPFNVCVSLPFDDLRILKTRYDQAAFALSLNPSQAGVFRGEDTALQCLFASDFVRAQQLAHPLLQRLRAHDAQKNGELYETLRQYLIHERSLQHGANAMHVHKNTFSYRLERIRELSGVDLDDPMTRLYLLASYAMEDAQSARDAGK